MLGSFKIIFLRGCSVKLKEHLHKIHCCYDIILICTFALIS